MLKSRGSRVGKSNPLDNIIRSIIKHVILLLSLFIIVIITSLFPYIRIFFFFFSGYYINSLKNLASLQGKGIPG